MSSSSLSDSGSNAAAPGRDSAAGREPRGERGAPQAPSAVAVGASIWRDAALDPGLYIVSTPIGNLRDISLRALDVLASADCVYAEDTRIARKLLDAYGVKTHLRAYHDHNGAKARPALLADLAGGARIALISDAGTPLVSDPGFKLVRAAAEAGLTVTAIPGASAPLAALAASGLPTDRFLFAGFPPPKAAARAAFFKEIAPVAATLILFEGPSRLAASLADMAAAFGDRDAVLARELTKKFEEHRRAPLGELAGQIAETGPPKGELVVLIGPPKGPAPTSEDALDALIAKALEDGRPVKAAAAEIAETTGRKKRDVYARILALKDDDV